jgi:NAD(P)-dependent dehydrogenase (short-subunit alcohol dehydrogenase family)
MKLTIVAATGGIGRHLLEQAVAAGHQATAVVRNPSKLAGQAVGVVTADLAAADPAVLESAAAGADAVLSGLGPRSTSQTCPAGSLGSTVGQPRRCEGFFRSPGAVIESHTGRPREEEAVMRKVVESTLVSLDGVIRGPDGLGERVL